MKIVKKLERNIYLAANEKKNIKLKFRNNKSVYTESYILSVKYEKNPKNMHEVFENKKLQKK